MLGDPRPHGSYDNDYWDFSKQSGIGALLLQRRLPAATVIAAMEIGSVDPQVMAIEARRLGDQRPKVVVVPLVKAAAASAHP